jgi:MFS transporter, Spinster family, sphingosine-1-phosphate transporter
MVWGKKLSRNDGMYGKRQEGARFALLVLSGINLLNFADRYVPSGVKELIKDDLHLTDAETSLPTTGMIFVYMIFAIIFGWIGDKGLMDRRTLLALGICSWSLATALAGLSQNLTQLILFRSLVGIGEAAYATVAPPMISDFYPHVDRNIAFGIYYLAIPVGSALGFGIGSVLGALFSWRVAFLAVGLPGVVLSISVLFCNDPVPGLNDENLHNSSSPTASFNSLSLSGSSTGSSSSSQDSVTELVTTTSPLTNSSETPLSTSSTAPLHINSFTYQQLIHDLQVILTNPHYNLSLAGLIANLFAMGGLAEWFPSFLNRYSHMSISESGLVIGSCMVIGGIGGNMLGAKTTEYYHSSKLPNSHFFVSAIYTAPATLFLFIAINFTGSTNGIKSLTIICIFLGVICLFTNLAPMASLSITCIPPSLRARSCALQILLQHVLGDMISPPLIGLISDETNSLKTGLQITWVAIICSGIFWFVGYSCLKPLNIPLTHSHASTTYMDILFDRQQQQQQQLKHGEEFAEGREGKSLQGLELGMGLEQGEGEEEEGEDIALKMIQLESR